MYNNLLNTSNLLFYSQYQILLFYRLLYYFFTIIIENYKINTNYTYRIKYWGIINKKIPPLNSEVFISSFFLYNIDLQPLTFNPLKHQKSLSTSFTLHSKTQNQNATPLSKPSNKRQSTSLQEKKTSTIAHPLARYSGASNLIRVECERAREGKGCTYTRAYTISRCTGNTSRVSSWTALGGIRLSLSLGDGGFPPDSRARAYVWTWPTRAGSLLLVKVAYAAVRSTKTSLRWREGYLLLSSCVCVTIMWYTCFPRLSSLSGWVCWVVLLWEADSRGICRDAEVSVWSGFENGRSLIRLIQDFDDCDGLLFGFFIWISSVQVV